jgi:hypothetical protein
METLVPWSIRALVQLVKELDCPESDPHSSKTVGKANLWSTWSYSSFLEPVVEGQNKMVDYKRSKSQTLRFTNNKTAVIGGLDGWSFLCIILNLRDLLWVFLFSVFIICYCTWRSSPPSAIWGCSIVWWYIKYLVIQLLSLKHQMWPVLCIFPTSVLDFGNGLLLNILTHSLNWIAKADTCDFHWQKMR